MYVVLALAGLAVLGAIVVVAMGRGGELALARPDIPPPRDDGWTAGEPAVSSRLPRGLWGYQVDITDTALRRLSHELTERDARIATLERQLAELRGRRGTEPPRADPAGEPDDEEIG